MDDTKSIWHQFGAAIVSGNVDEFQRVAKEHPEWPDNNGGLGYLHDISLDGVHMFKAFVEHFPQTKDWDCGHAGNPVGIAAFNNNIPLLKYVLEDLGHKANEGCFFYRPALRVVYDKPDREEVVKILEAHGATLEGEGYCYQKLEIRKDWRLYWLRIQRNSLYQRICVPRVIQRPKEIFERFRNLFSKKEASRKYVEIKEYNP